MDTVVLGERTVNQLFPGDLVRKVDSKGFWDFNLIFNVTEKFVYAAPISVERRLFSNDEEYVIPIDEESSWVVHCDTFTQFPIMEGDYKVFGTTAHDQLDMIKRKIAFHCDIPLTFE